MLEIKSCPFCRGYFLDTGDNWDGYAYVHCYDCGGHMEGKNELEAIEKWNKRIGSN